LRLFGLYALVSFVPVLVLGVVLGIAFRHDADARGLGEARAEAGLLARTAIEPMLSGNDLRGGPSAEETASLQRLAGSAVTTGQIIRFRLRDLDGQVVYSSDGSGLHEPADDEALEAAQGDVVASITRLNADNNPTGHQGVRAAEVYWPLAAGSGASVHSVGVLEIYLPYAPIAHDVDAGLGTLYRDLGLGLAVLYVLLAFISWSVTRRLRNQVVRSTYLAEHDGLTGLPNRVLFHQRLSEALAAAERGGPPVAVALIDLDRFKEVNDTLGHGNGDILLRELGRRLHAAVRGHDTVARLGGDEFGLILVGHANADAISAALARLRADIEQEVEVSGLPLSAEASIGFAMAPEDGSDADTVLQHADVAMYVAKGGAPGVVRYDATQDHYDSTKLALVAELRRAIQGNELVLHYQPKAVVSTGEIVAIEALVRWEHPERGLLYPDAFLPIAEQTGIIDALTQWVLTTALHQLGTWGPEADGLALAVNISARNLSRSEFSNSVLAALAAAGVSPDRLLLEMTETALLVDPDRAGTTLRQLAAAGVRISLDDFGRGQTSLGYLSTLPLHEVKIDKSFVTDMVQDRSHAAIVRSVIDLAHNLGFEVVAEGVETEQTLAALAAAGCDIAQGYLLARPMSGSRLISWLLVHQSIRQDATVGRSTSRP
jgi:diguanylate cyclase (GGDEF)-like protein